MSPAIKPLKDHKHGKISWEELSMEDANQKSPLYSFDDIKLLTNNFSHGRFTLRGPNGSGKSTVLAMIKKAQGDRAFFLPANSSLLFFSTYGKNYSSGENLLSIMNEIENSIDETLLLLDEWDANLDNENVEILSKIINKISCNKCVIEVRHRKQ